MAAKNVAALFKIGEGRRLVVGHQLGVAGDVGIQYCGEQTLFWLTIHQFWFGPWPARPQSDSLLREEARMVDAGIAVLRIVGIHGDFVETGRCQW